MAAATQIYNIITNPKTRQHKIELTCLITNRALRYGIGNKKKSAIKQINYKTANSAKSGEAVCVLA